MRPARLWLVLFLVLAGSFGALGWFGGEIYRAAPPVPDRVVTRSGELVFDGDSIWRGQRVWQSIGGQELGSVWGHGAYVAPDWSADFLHRELEHALAGWSGASGYAALPPEQQAALRERLTIEYRTNGYDPATRTLTISDDRARAIRATALHYEDLFGDAPGLDSLRSAYAMPAGTVKDAGARRDLAAFFFWTAWACATTRPGSDITYTNNWPSEPLIGNVPAGSTVVWSVVSFVLLLAGVGALAWWFAVERRRSGEEIQEAPHTDPLLGLTPTPSMRATLKYFWVVTALLVVQIGLGAVTAHYGVEGSGFYGFPLAKVLPYTVARTWHLQLGILWIATAWLATGLYIAPAVAGAEPRGQRFGVNLLFVALLVVVVGSLAGEWLSVQQRLPLGLTFWLGHQGFEYVDLGRVWQIALLVGLFLWLGLMLRALWPALRRPSAERHLLGLFTLSAAAIAGFYAAGLGWGQRTNLAIAEYWRWWVVHLWVEGFFEVFATVVIAFLFVRMGLLRAKTATVAVLFSTSVFLFGGILGTFHHLYFTGTTTPVIAVGASFSALEVVPLVLVGFEAYENLTRARARSWVRAYRWPIYCFVAVGFWNLVGAGLFGFFINPPIALYYMQGLNTTPVHGHTALFGVYGMLGIGLMLFCLRSLTKHYVWRQGVIATSFWLINIGLALMVLISVLPVGLIQTWASVEHGYWYARSAELLQQPIVATLRWLRLVGDTLFAIGALLLGWFVIGLKTGWSHDRRLEPALEEVGIAPSEAPAE